MLKLRLQWVAHIFTLQIFIDIAFGTIYRHKKQRARFQVFRNYSFILGHSGSMHCKRPL